MGATIPHPFDRILAVLHQKIIIPCGEGLNGTEVMCVVPRNMNWKVLQVSDIANLMFFLTQILTARYALFNPFCLPPATLE